MPQDAIESVLVHSMSVATAVVVPNEPSISQVIKNGASDSETESNGDDESQNNSKPTLPQDILVRNININTKYHFWLF